ncbi:MAG TPA: Fic family protein [Candidatus Elarobacter sp.]
MAFGEQPLPGFKDALDLDKFVVDLSVLPFSFWKQLGEARSKCEHILRAPLMPETWEELQRVYLVRGVHSTTAIEGNTLTEAEVMAIFRRELTLPPSRAYLGIEADNIIKAMNAAWAEPLRETISRDEICQMNAQVLAGLMVAPHVTPGEYRHDVVTVGRYVCPRADDVPRFVDKFVSWYNEFPAETPGIDGLSMSIIKAIAAHMYFVLIHPFGDGNGRTARLIEWRTLDHGGIASVATHVLSNHYNLTRTRYYEMLDQASMGRNLTPFFCYAIQGLVDQLSSQLDYLHQQYADLVYIDIVRSRTPGHGADVIKRRQELAIAIARSPKPVPRSQISALTSTLARSYGRTTEKTLSRDLTALQGASLIRSTSQGWKGVTDTMYWRHRRDMFERRRSRRRGAATRLGPRDPEIAP